MTRDEIVDNLILLGNFFRTVSNNGTAHRLPEGDQQKVDAFKEVLRQAYLRNKWFTPQFTMQALEAWSKNLTGEKLAKWVGNYPLSYGKPQTVALIMAGNIPMVGFHDLIAVLLSGHKALVKLSSDDDVLMKEVIRLLQLQHRDMEKLITVSDGPLKHFDAAIATGSDNSSRYFEYYFGKYPHIIRRNRTSLAVLKGIEDKKELRKLGGDIFTYFGLGCRNVSHLLVPQEYGFKDFFEAIFPYGEVISHNKYCNNYDYHKAIFLLEKIKFLDNNFLMLRESPELFSPLSVVHYSLYENENEVSNYILDHKDRIQAVIGREFLPFGTAQEPELWDYADGVDTLQFLHGLR